MHDARCTGGRAWCALQGRDDHRSQPGRNTFVTANLGVVLDQAGKQVVMIDGDLRKDCLHTYFGAASRRGLSD